MKTQFGRSGCYNCEICGKQTRQTLTGGEEAAVSLCRACYDAAEEANKRSDATAIAKAEGRDE